MNIVDIIKGFEKLVVQVLLLIIYLPKTIVKIIKDPKWVPDYVTEESRKPNGYQDYVSPVMLYLIIAVIGVVVIRMLWGIESTIEDNESSGNSFISGVLTNLESSSGVIIAFISIILPLFSALLIELFSSKNFSSDSLVRFLYIQCYYFSPLLLALIGYGIVFSLLEDSTKNWDEIYKIIYSTPLAFILIITLVWFIVNQVRFISKDTKKENWKSLILILMGIGIIFISTRVYNWFTPDSIVNEKAFGQQESLDFKVSGGDYKIQVTSDLRGADIKSEYDLSLAEIKADLVCPTNYPFQGYLEHNQKVLGSVHLQTLCDSIFSSQSSDNYPPLDTASWNFNGNTGENLIVAISPFETSGSLLFHVADSTGEELTSKHKPSEFVLFRPKYDGIYNLIISRSSPSDEIKNYQLALLDENKFLHKIKWRDKDIDSSSNTKILSHTLIKFINDSISYPLEGMISKGQKIRASISLNEFGWRHRGQWQFEGSYFDEYMVLAEPIGNNKDSIDLALDVRNDSNISIFKYSRIPFLVMGLIVLIFGFGFIQGIIGRVNKDRSKSL